MGYGYGENEALLVLLGILTLVLLIAGPIMYVVTSIFLMKIFGKAGVEGGWRAWVPIYREMIFFKLGDMSPWLVLYVFGAVLLSSLIGIGGLFGLAFMALYAMAGWRVGLKLQKEAAWVILFVLLNPVWLGILAFDRSRWNAQIPPAPWAGNGFLGDNTVWEGVPVQPGQNVAAAGGHGAQGYGAPGYGSQGYAPPAATGYTPPAPQGYAPPAAPGYVAPTDTPQAYGAPPAQPGYPAPHTPDVDAQNPGAPVPPGPGPSVPPPTAPPAPPTEPPAAPTAPPAAPPAPPADGVQPPVDPDRPATDPNRPPA